MAKASSSDKSPSSKTPEVVPLTGPAMSKAELAYKLRLRGRSGSQIAEELGYASANEVNQAIQVRFKQEAQFLTAEDRAGILAMEMARLDFMLDRVWDSVEYGDPKAMDIALKIHAARVKVTKLDAPETGADRATVLVVGGEEAAYITSLKKMVG